MAKKNKQEKMKPYKPLPYREGNTIVQIYEREEMDEMGFKTLIKYCDYTDKKKNLHEGHILQVTQLGNDNILEQSEIDTFLKSCVEETLPFAWHDGYVLGFVKVEEELHLMMAWQTVHGKLWEDVYFKVNPEFEKDVLEYYKIFDPSLTEEEEELLNKDESKGSFDGFINHVNEGLWITDIVFIKRTMASYSGVRGEIAKLRLKSSWK